MLTFCFPSWNLSEIKLPNRIFLQTLTSGKDDFAVVLQPFLQNTFIPQVGVREADSSFFSVDCFHINERAHAEMAIALWNNMLEPVGRKQAYNNFTYDRSKIHCPSEVCVERSISSQLFLLQQLIHLFDRLNNCVFLIVCIASLVGLNAKIVCKFTLKANI
uniref:Uncharacterized protein n=1 Tax=Labrus bergylta TaxID=56723 RepID=A0A3Q3F9W6_9LABR